MTTLHVTRFSLTLLIALTWRLCREGLVFCCIFTMGHHAVPGHVEILLFVGEEGWWWRGGQGGQFTNPFICSAQRMSVWFQLGAAICLLRNKLKWITRLMAFWLGAVQTGGSQGPAFLSSSLSRVDEDGTRHHARPLSGSGQPGESSRWLLCTWLTRWNMSRAFSLGDDGWGWD